MKSTWCSIYEKFFNSLCNSQSHCFACTLSHAHMKRERERNKHFLSPQIK